MSGRPPATVKRDSWHLSHDHELFYVYYRVNGMDFGQHVYGARRVIRFLKDELGPRRSHYLISVRSMHRKDPHDV